MPMAIENTDHGCRIRVHASPRASRTHVIGYYDERVKIQLAAPPVDGAANKELVRFLAKELGVPKSNVVLCAGATGKRKTVEVAGIDLATATTLLGL
jgi:hypothetical protein